MKQIETLIEDIKKVFTEPHKFDEGRVEAFGKRLAQAIASKINPTQSKPTLRMSNLGTKCDRQLWYKINKPGDGEKLSVETRIKFLFGHILEEMLLFLAEEAGHTVTGTQDTVELEGIIGHRDAIIDGVLVDAKSASSMAYKKFKSGLTYEDDAFGYLTQLNAYLEASKDDPLLLEKDRAAFLVIDKQFGHICLDMHKKSDMDHHKIALLKKDAVAAPEAPHRGYTDEEDGKSGNRKLGTACGYCDYKKTCWPSLRTFIYSNGPRFLTRVERLPDVPEA